MRPCGTRLGRGAGKKEMALVRTHIEERRWSMVSKTRNVDTRRLVAKKNVETHAIGGVMTSHVRVRAISADAFRIASFSNCRSDCEGALPLADRSDRCMSLTIEGRLGSSMVHEAIALCVKPPLAHFRVVLRAKDTGL